MQRFLFHKNKKNLTDEELLNFFIQKQNPEFLGELFSRYTHLVFGLCLKYLKDTEKSKDAVIDIYEKLQNEIQNHNVKNFKSWLYVVSKNYCLMKLRKTKTGETFVVGNEVELEKIMENETGLHPIDKEQNEITDKALFDCIEKLNEEQKRCINLFYFENKCYREISEIEKTEEKKVKSRIQNGKRNLKICLEKKNDE